MGLFSYDVSSIFFGCFSYVSECFYPLSSTRLFGGLDMFVCGWFCMLVISGSKYQLVFCVSQFDGFSCDMVC